MSDRSVKEVVAQYEAAVLKLCAEPTMLGTFKIALDPENIYLWWISISAINDEFAGEYIFALTCEKGDKFLTLPPHFKCYTPNGSMGIKMDRICISIGGYHVQNYRAVLGIGGFVLHIAAALIESAAGTLGDGIELLKSTRAERVAYAYASAAYNRDHNAAILTIIDEAQAGNAIIISRKAATPAAPKPTARLFGAAAKRAAIAAMTPRA